MEKKFEYLAQGACQGIGVLADQHLPMLNAKGAQGWELVSVVSSDEVHGPASLMFFFKREILQAEAPSEVP
jgi:hypothetical protein